MKKFIAFLLVSSSLFITSCSNDDEEVITPAIVVENYQVTHTLTGTQTVDTVKVSVTLRNVDTNTLAYARVGQSSGFFSDFQLTRSSGDLFKGQTIIYDTDTSSGTYPVRLYLKSEPTGHVQNITILWQSSTPTGTLAANLAEVFNKTPNSGTTTVNFVNTTTAAVTGVLKATGTMSGIQNFNVSLPISTFSNFNQTVNNLFPGETVNLQLTTSAGTSLATKSFSVPLVAYSNISHTTGSGSSSLSTTQNQTNIAFSRTVFTSTGVTNFSTVKFYFKSNTTGVNPWDVLLLLGKAGNNVVVNTSSAWTAMGDGWYRVTIPLTDSISLGTNQQNFLLSTKTYTLSTPANFSYKLEFVDGQGVVFETSSLSLTTN
jgi:hypothetical protein